MKIGILSDIHGNYQALKAILEDTKLENCDQLICLGDSIGIGPEPLKTLDLLLSHKVIMIMGNHEQYYLMENKKLEDLLQSDIQYQHHLWVKKCLGDKYKSMVGQFFWTYKIESQSKNLYFSHYGIDNEWFMPIITDYTKENLKKMFSSRANSIYFFGHDHKSVEIKDHENDILYYNPGSSGCTPKSETRYGLLEILEDSYRLFTKEVPYNREKTLQAFDDYGVVGKEIIKTVFYSVKD